ncbi:hypothetical protein BH11PAT4_BH11PAT4_2220 [soil metagenome]
MQELLSFWFVKSGPQALTMYRRTIAGFEANLAIATTAKNLSKPLFQDYTYQGRVIGFGFRILRILMGSILYFLIALVYALLFIAWLVFPIACIVSLVASLVAPPLSSSTIPGSSLREDSWNQ